MVCDGGCGGDEVGVIVAWLLEKKTTWCERGGCAQVFEYVEGYLYSGTGGGEGGVGTMIWRTPWVRRRWGEG